MLFSLAHTNTSLIFLLLKFPSDMMFFVKALTLFKTLHKANPITTIIDNFIIAFIS